MPPLLSLPLSAGKMLALLSMAVLVIRNVRAGRAPLHLPPWEWAFGIAGLCLVTDGVWLGLVDAPRERMMGDAGRILYVHVPSAWTTLVSFAFASAFAFGWLMTSRRTFDLLMEATAEVGVVMGAILLTTGSAFARPTWGVWWSWDPRLTSTAVMEISFVGVLLLRAAVSDPERRATWSAVASILAAVSMVVTYVSVKLWRSLHQDFSSPDTIDPMMTAIMRMNAFGFLMIGAWMTARRYRIAAWATRDEVAPPLPEARSVVHVASAGADAATPPPGVAP
jgi:heme exporter protein C